MKYCCGYFPKIASRFGWFSYTDDSGDEIYLMPYLSDSDGQKTRINYCPVCGAETRSIRIPEVEFLKLTEGGEG
jgi:hypothetical protein